MSPDSFLLLNELCQLMTIILNGPKQVSNATSDIAFRFIGSMFRLYGQTIEINSDHGSGNRYPASDGIEVAHLLRSLILKVIGVVQESLGHVWTKPSEQDNGQVAFESKPMPTQKVVLKSSESLGEVLDFLIQGLVFCPKFLIHLPSPGSGPPYDNNTSSDDFLLRRAVDAATASLEEYSDMDRLRSAIHFLKTLVRTNIFC